MSSRHAPLVDPKAATEIVAYRDAWIVRGKLEAVHPPEFVICYQTRAAQMFGAWHCSLYPGLVFYPWSEGKGEVAGDFPVIFDHRATALNYARTQLAKAKTEATLMLQAIESLGWELDALERTPIA